MLRVGLSVLSRPELRRLLDQAHARGQAGLAEQIQAELDARASGGAAAKPIIQPSAEEDEPWPMQVPDEPLARPGDLRLDTARGPTAPGRRRSVGLAVAMVTAAFGLAFGWGFLGAPGLPGREAAPAMVASAPVSPRLAPPAAPAPPRAEVARLDAPAVSPDETPPPEPAPREEKAIDASAKATDAIARPRRLDPCATPPTPADRLLCHDLALNLLERELRDAYGRALDSGADPARLRADQAAWRAERDPVGDPQALARLYDRRIRDLKAQVAAPALDRQ